ncbi:MAG: hypothetical protein ABJB47_02620 [Actinomycetota bacterium]
MTYDLAIANGDDLWHLTIMKGFMRLDPTRVQAALIFGRPQAVAPRRLHLHHITAGQKADAVGTHLGEDTPQRLRKPPFAG